MTVKKSSSLSFEKALERLETIASRLESEGLGLDASLALFEEGIELARACQQSLTEVERRVEIVLKESGEEFKTRPFPGDEDEEDDSGSGDAG